LDQAIFPADDAFAEVGGQKVVLFDDFAGFEADFADRGVAFETGAFVEEAAIEKEAFGERLGVVRISVNDLVRVRGDAGRNSVSAAAGNQGQNGQQMIEKNPFDHTPL
jgi:hypothetical protein